MSTHDRRTQKRPGPTLQDFIAALLWMARDSDNRIPQSIACLMHFLFYERRQGWREAPKGLKPLLERMKVVSDGQGIWSFPVEQAMTNLEMAGYFETPCGQHLYSTILKGQRSVDELSPENHRYIANLARRFNAAYCGELGKQDELTALLAKPILPDFLKALMWSARNGSGKVTSSDGAFVRFLKEEIEKGDDSIPQQIKEIYEEVTFYENYGNAYSREIDGAFVFMSADGTYEHPHDQRSWRKMRTGEAQLARFDAEAKTYLLELGNRFRKEHPVAA